MASAIPFEKLKVGDGVRTCFPVNAVPVFGTITKIEDDVVYIRTENGSTVRATKKWDFFPYDVKNA